MTNVGVCSGVIERVVVHVDEREGVGRERG